MRNSIALRLHHWSTILLAIAIPLPDRFIPAFLLLWILCWFLNIINKPVLSLDRRILFAMLGLVTLYILILIAFIFRHSTDIGFVAAGRRIALLIVPVFLIFNNSGINKKAVLSAFIAGNMAFMLFILVQFIACYFSNELSSEILNKNLLFKEIIIRYKHCTYLGLNLSISTIFVFYIFDQESNKGLKHILAVTFIVIATAIFIYLSYARIALVTYIIVVILCLFISIRQTYLKFLTAAVFIIFSSLLVIKNPRFEEVFSLRKSDNLSLEIDLLDRKEIWNNAFEAFKSKPLFGYGIGSSRETIAWSKNDMLYNSHNQFLEYLIEGGLIAALLFIASLAFLIIYTIKTRNYYWTLALIAVIIVMITESMLNRISGLALFSLILWVTGSENIYIDSKWKVSRYVLPISLTLMLGLFLSIVLIRSVNTFDPKNPKTFSDRKGKLIKFEDLPGILPDSVVNDSKGYMLDYQSSSLTWSGNAYTYNKFASVELAASRSLRSSVFCYVSKDFDGDWVRLSSEGMGTCKQASFYNMDKKGTWQYLSIEPICDSEQVDLLLFFSKYNVSDMTSLEGYVIFLHPTFQVF